MTRIFSVFDCCRVPLSNMPGLASGRGVGHNDEESADEEDDEMPCKYFHIQACGPGGIADADGGFAKRLLECCKKFAGRNPKGYMKWPYDFAKTRWTPGEMSMTGGEDYLMPFGPHAMKAVEENKKLEAVEESKEPPK